MFAKVASSCSVRRHSWQRVVRSVPGERALEKAEGDIGEGEGDIFIAEGFGKSQGRAALSQIHRHRLEPLLHPRHPQVRQTLRGHLSFE